MLANQGHACPALSPVRACWLAFPSAPALRSTDSAAATASALLCSPVSSLLWQGSTSRARASSATAPRLPDADQVGISACGQTRDLPVSDALLLHVMCSSTPAGRQHLAYRCCSCCVRRLEPSPPPAIKAFRGSITHPMKQLCTLRVRPRGRLTQHSPPGGSLRLTRAGLSPAERASLLAPSLIRFRQFIGGSLALASLNLTRRDILPTLTATLTTIAFDCGSASTQNGSLETPGDNGNSRPGRFDPGT